jgi:long-subunit fatty acid transport protein
MSTVYVLRYRTAYDCNEMVSVYSNLKAVLNRLEISDLHDNFEQDETMTIECMEVTSEETSLQRLNNMRAHYTNKKSN